MALTDFKPHFDLAYQETFLKVLVSKEVASMRFEPTLKSGESVERPAYDTSSVRVRTVSRGSASTIDSISDSSELLTINYEKESVFHLSEGEITQAGPLNPGMVIGRDIAHKVAEDFDANIFSEVLNADQTFDTGDLTTLASTGTPITLSSTTVPQMVTRMPAKLRRKNIKLTNSIFVLDSYGVAEVDEYLLSKNIDLAGSVFKNGYTGTISSASIYVSENLASTSVLGLATNPTNGKTLTINGTTVTFVSSIGTTAGNVLIAGTVDATRANLAGLINNPETTSANQVAYSDDDDIAVMNKLTATNDNTADTLTIQGVGTGRMTLAETLSDGTDTWTKTYIHAYFGQKGGIDAVMQDVKEVDMRPTADRLGYNVFAYILGGYKTFTDGSKKFLDVQISATA